MRRRALLLLLTFICLVALGLASTPAPVVSTSPPPATAASGDAHGAPAAGESGGNHAAPTEHGGEGHSSENGGEHGGGHSSEHHSSSDGELYPPTFSEEEAARALQWVCFMISLMLALFYFWQYYIGTSKWEVLYVCFFESLAYIFDIWYLHKNPISLVFKQGHHAEWLRYMEWLLTCPILLIALSRVGVADGAYSKRTMRLLTSDQGTILMGVTAAFAQGYVRLGFYLVGCAFGFNTYYTAAAVYLEAWRNVPDAEKDVVKWMATIYYFSWVMFPVLFAIGSEGLGYITLSGSVIGHCIADLLSKNVWGLLEWYLEFCVHSRYHAELAALEEEEEEEEGEEGA
nr:protein 114 [synthetic construct]